MATSKNRGCGKINTEACFNIQNNIGSAGIIGKDYNEDVVFGITKHFPVISPIMAEALALREAAAVAVNFGLSMVLLENDCLDLIRTCRLETTKGEIMNILADILSFPQNLRGCGFTWVAKEGNKVAHLLAKMTLQAVLPTSWCWNHPPSIRESLLKDKSSVLSRRTKHITS